MKFYKVTTIIGLSVITRNLYYRLGYTTVPEYGKILVFDTLKHAKNYAGSQETIFEGTAVNPKRIRNLVYFPVSCPDYEMFRLMKLFWKEKQNRKKHSMTTILVPVGTYACDSFTPEIIAQKGINFFPQQKEK